MKGKMLAAAMATLLLVLVASCSPNPGVDDGEVYGFAQPVTLELSGRDADRFICRRSGRRRPRAALRHTLA